jgi:type II secretory pathway component GspD/PulD (secretin)
LAIASPPAKSYPHPSEETRPPMKAHSPRQRTAQAIPPAERSQRSPRRRCRGFALSLALAAALLAPRLAAQEEGRGPEDETITADQLADDAAASPSAPHLAPLAVAPGEERAPVMATREASPESEPAPRVRFVIRDQPIGAMLSVIKQALGADLIPRGDAADQVITEFRVDDLTLDELLAKIHNELGWQWYHDDTMPPNTYELYTDENFRTMVLPHLVIEKSFYLENIPSSTAAEFVEPMLSEVGSVADIPRTNEIIVTDLPQYVEAVERLIRQIDTRLFVRVFRIRFADTQQIADAIERFRSPDGSIEMDERNHTIIVEDLIQNIRRMELMVELLDKGTELKTYPLNYLSEDDIGSLQDALESVITPGALLTVDSRTSTLVLDDTPEVQRRAAELIAAWDQPTRQIMLQADVVQVKTSSALNLETSFAYSGDLLAASADSLVSGVPTGGDTGFTNFRGEFPYFVLDQSGLRFEYLSSHFRALLTASLKNSDTRLLLSPRIQVKDKEPATIDVGGEVPFVTTTINDSSNVGTRTFTQQAVREGLLMEVTPFIGNNGYVELQVHIENNKANIEKRTVIDGVIEVVARTTQQLETSLIIPDGGTRVIAGLLTSTSEETHTGIPLLSNLPYLGWLFGASTNNEVRDNLMVFLTPTIIVEAATDYQWRPLYDERPVSSRFQTPMPPEPGPVLPPDLEILAPLTEQGVGPMLMGESLRPAEEASPEGYLLPELPSLIPEGREPSEEAVPVPSLGPPTATEMGPFRGPAPTAPEEASPEWQPSAGGEESPLPLVEEILTAPVTSEEMPQAGPMNTSFREQAVPRPQGELSTTGGGPSGARTSAASPRRTSTQVRQPARTTGAAGRQARTPTERGAQQRPPAQRETSHRATR